MKAEGSYSVKKWEEKTYEEVSPQMKLAKASVEYSIHGDIEGTASEEYVMFYRYVDPDDQHKASATYVGLIRFEGKVFGRSGSFVLEDQGTLEGGAANSILRIANGSGTGALRGIMGTGRYSANGEGNHIELDYEVP